MTQEEYEPGVASVARFMNAFNAIEAHLRRNAPPERRESFHQLVDGSSELTRQQARRLKDIADLRNAIVHNPGGWSSEPIAVPRQDVVDWIELQVELVLSPPTVLRVLNPVKPKVFAASDPLAKFLGEIVENDFSQILFRTESSRLEILTTNALARWLSHGFARDSGVVLEGASLDEVARFREASETLTVSPRSLTAVEAARTFAGSGASPGPAAIVITEHGKLDEVPLGLCVRQDVALLLAVVGA